MRVITGTAKGRKLITLEGMDVRPTTDRVKEGLFSIIQFDLPGAMVLDLFAGSGQLGIEALSRGASTCVFVDQSRKAQEVQKQNLQHCNLMSRARVVLNDALTFLAGTKDQYDIVLMDPPYHKEMIPATLQALSGKLTENGVIICETGIRDELPEQVGEFQQYRTYQYGKIKLTTYRMVEA